MTPTRTLLAGLAASICLLVAPIAGAEPYWSQLTFTVPPSNASKVLAAADEFMRSEVGQTFPGRLLLQANVADGSSPATHTFVPIYKSAADRETFVQALQGNPAWATFQEAMERAGTPAGTVLYRNVARWGDINDTDSVWIAHAFDVSDPAAFAKAIEDFMASETGQQFPGQVYLSSVLAGGLSPVSHVISVGYDSEAEMAQWLARRDASADWTAYQSASTPTAEYLGATLARDIKSWGPAGMKDIAGAGQ